MSAYKPYKPVPLKDRCPHGYNIRECGTCVAAEKSAVEYWKRQAAIRARSNT